MPIGNNTINIDPNVFGSEMKITADGVSDYKTGGFTVDWNGVTAPVNGADYGTPQLKTGIPAAGVVVTTDLTLLGGRVIKVGEKFIRYGAVIRQSTADGETATTGLYRPAAGAVTTGTGTTATTTAADTLVRGKTFLMQYTISDAEASSPTFGGAIEGGQVYQRRLAVDGAGQPTQAALEAVLPNITFLEGNLVNARG